MELTRSKVIGISVICVIAGLSIGALAGSWVTSGFWIQKVNSALVSTGDQAHNSAVLLRSGETEELRLYLESEMAHSLQYLDLLEQQNQIPEGSPMLLIHERLREYEAQHQIAESVSSSGDPEVVGGT